nr:MAG TPA: 4Fe-4S binding domain protein [Bacteriophage sp.]
MHPPAGISPKIVPVRKSYQYGNQMGAKNAPMQKVHRCRLCTPTCPACRLLYSAAASSSLTPARLN